MTGIGTKPHDKYAIPLCGKHHRDQHAIGESRFWRSMDMDPVKKALALYSVSGDYEQGIQIINGR